VRAAYLECDWSGPIMGQLNPLDEANAAKVRIDTGLSTLEEEVAQISGGADWKTKHEQRVREHAARVDGDLEPQIANVVTRATVTEANPDGSPASTADKRDAADQKAKDGNSNNGGADGQQ
jgi:capsid protein